MFDFLDMIDNYEERLVANDKRDDVEVDTVLITDAEYQYETAVRHPKYNDNEWIIVQGYDTKERAMKGHNHWVKVMTADILPAKLVDVSTAKTAKFVDEVTGDNSWREFNKDTK